MDASQIGDAIWAGISVRRRVDLGIVRTRYFYTVDWTVRCHCEAVGGWLICRLGGRGRASRIQILGSDGVDDVDGGLGGRRRWRMLCRVLGTGGDEEQRPY